MIKIKVKIRLDTFSDATHFVEIASNLKGKIVITDGAGLCVSAKSILGALHAMEFENLWCESETDIYNEIKEFVT